MNINFWLVIFVAGVSAVDENNNIPVKDAKFKLHSGDLMPMVGLGTARIKGNKQVHEVLDYALAAGYKLFDTAKIYKNEEEIGKALKELLPKYNMTRQDIWITTKLAPDDQGEKAYDALKESIKKLDCGYVDLYLIHWPGSFSGEHPDRNNSLLRDESWKQMVRGVKDGLARNIGVSNYVVRHLNELLANDYGTKPACNQIEWHPNYHPKDVFDFCRQNGILLQAYSSLGGNGNTDLLRNTKVGDIAKKLGKSPAQLLLRWSIQQNIAVIPKATSQKHIAENIDLDFVIPEEDMQILNSFGAPNKYGGDPESIE